MNKFEQEYYKVLGLDSQVLSRKFPNGFFPMIPKDIIEEMKHLELNIGQPALGYLKSKLRLDIPMLVDNDILKNKIFKRWRYYDKFYIGCMDTKLWMLEVDFSRLDKAVKIIKKIDDGFDKDKEWHSSNAYGEFINLANDNYMILINEAAYKDETAILHEFTHYVQFVTHELLSDTSNIPKKIKAFFHLEDEFINYICDENEFYVNIFNDLFNGLQNIYWINFKDKLTWEDFIDLLMKDIKQNLCNYRDSLSSRFWINDSSKGISHLDVLACISYVDEQFFDDIVEKLKNK